MVGRRIDDVLGPSVGAPFSASVRRVHATGEAEQLEYPLDVGGARRWFFADVKRVGTPETGMTVVMLARDITSQRERDEALRRSEERYRLAATATNDILWDHDIVAGTITWSSSTKKVLGYDEVMTSDVWWHERIHPDDARRVLAELNAAFAGGASSWSGTYRFRRSDGTYGEFIDRALIVRDAGGVVRRAVGSLIDVTQLNRLQAQLLRSDRLAALGVLAAGIGHEINNPLTYVSGNIAIALEALAAQAADAEVVAALREAHDGAVRIAEIVKTLKMFSRADDTKLGPVDVHAVLERAIRMADNEIRHRARLVRSFERLPHVHASESQLAQVFLNLLINAAQAIEEGAKDSNELRVTTGLDAQGRVFISFTDTGCGITPEDLPRVFDPFFTTKANGSGTGLGLSICQGIVQKLHGWLEVTSELRKGTTFTVRLAANGAGGAEPQPASIERAAATSRPRVLVIDDEPAVGRTITRMLRDDAEVVSVRSAREGLARLGVEEFNFVLCDVMMPEMTGIDFHETICRERPELLSRLYFMTGGAFTAKAEHFLSSLGVNRIDKPVDPTQLRALVRAACAADDAH
jgi:PAS domain S-box-containing protein